MIISRERYERELHARWLEAYDSGHQRGLNEGKKEILDLIRNSDHVNIVHGDLKVEEGATLEDCTVFVIPEPPVGIKITGNEATVRGCTVTGK